MSHRKVIRQFNSQVDPMHCTCKCALALVLRKNAKKANCHRKGCGVGVFRKQAIEQMDDDIDPTDWYCYNCKRCNRIENGDSCSVCSFPQSWSEEYDSDLEHEEASRRAHAAFEKGYHS